MSTGFRVQGLGEFGFRVQALESPAQHPDKHRSTPDVVTGAHECRQCEHTPAFALTWWLLSLLDSSSLISAMHFDTNSASRRLLLRRPFTRSESVFSNIFPTPRAAYAAKRGTPVHDHSINRGDERRLRRK